MRSKAGKLILAGFIATIVITVMMYFIAPMMGRNMDIAQMLGSKMGSSWNLGMFVHFVLGSVIFSLIYGYFLYKILPGQPWIKGICFGIILWLLAQVIVMPMMGAGFFSVDMGGMKAVILSLIAHIAYGATLGGIAGHMHHHEAKKEG